MSCSPTPNLHSLAPSSSGPHPRTLRIFFPCPSSFHGVKAQNNKCNTSIQIPATSSHPGCHWGSWDLSRGLPLSLSPSPHLPQFQLWLQTHQSLTHVLGGYIKSSACLGHLNPSAPKIWPQKTLTRLQKLPADVSKFRPDLAVWKDFKQQTDLERDFAMAITGGGSWCGN